MKLPWRRAPLVAWGQPSSLLVALFAGLVLAFVATAAVLHVSSVRTAAVDYNVSRFCPHLRGPAVELVPMRFDGSVEAASLAQRSAADHGFDDGVVAGLYSGVLMLDFGESSGRAKLAYRDGLAEQVTVVRGGGTDGLWIPESLAELTGADLGDRPRQAGLGELPPVTAVYEDLERTGEGYWCSEEKLVVPGPMDSEWQSAPPVLVPDRDVLSSLQPPPAVVDELAVQWEDVSHATFTTTLRFPVDAPSTPEEAAALHDRSRAVVDDLSAELAREDFVSRGVYLERSLQLADESSRTVTLAVLPLTVVSLLVGLAGMAAVAVQWLQRRTREARLLWTHGTSPLALGTRALLELGLPVLVGSAAGLALATLARGLYAPSLVLRDGVLVDAALAVGGLVVASLAVLTATVAVRAHQLFQTAPRARSRAVSRLRLVPWELATGALAVWSGLRLAEGALTVESGEVLPRVDPVALAFPLLVVVTLAGLTARGLGWSLVRSHRLSAWRRPAFQFGIRRLAASGGTAVGVTALALLAVGVLAVGGGIVGAQRDAFDAKSGVLVGGESAVDVGNTTVNADQAVPASIAERSTLVGRSTTSIADPSREVTVLVVEPDTFHRGGWLGDRRIASAVDEALSALRAGEADRGPGDAAVPAVRVAGAPGGDQLRAGSGLVLSTVGEVTGFPGVTSPTYVVARDTVPSGFRVNTWTVLSALPAAEVVDRIQAGGGWTIQSVERTSSLDGLPFLTMEWTFGFITVLGTVLAVLAITSLLLAIEVRRRQNALSGALSLRMGVRPRTLVASYLVELGTIGGLAALVGAAVGWGAAQLAASQLDPAPRLVPVPAAPVPVLFLSVLLVATLAVVGAATWLAVRAVRTARVGELIRE
ncbi:ABC transporter permease [Actinoalloteichus caeruleus]|uniref:ABC transporter permease n=1 Tax=Actinoalloteichus cyanogriseus TaxID=2893586 RepID=UPI0012DF43D7|nr:ABC transporter permease [Actinoalloteichus caeruleus]